MVYNFELMYICVTKQNNMKTAKDIKSNDHIQQSNVNLIKIIKVTATRIVYKCINVEGAKTSVSGFKQFDYWVGEDLKTL